MMSSDDNWPKHNTDAPGWRSTAFVLALAAGIPATLIWGTQLLGINTTSEEAIQHAREGIPLIATAFGAGLVAFALILRQLNSYLDVRVSLGEKTLSATVEGQSKVDDEANRLEHPAALEDDSKSVVGDHDSGDTQTDEHPAIRANRLRQKHRDKEAAEAAIVHRRKIGQQFSDGVSAGLEVSGAVMLVVAGIAAVALWNSTAP